MVRKIGECAPLWSAFFAFRSSGWARRELIRQRNHKPLALNDFEMYKTSNLSTVLFKEQGSRKFGRFLGQPPRQESYSPS